MTGGGDVNCLLKSKSQLISLEWLISESYKKIAFMQQTVFK